MSRNRKDNLYFKEKGVKIGALGKALLDANVKNVKKSLNNHRNNYQKAMISKIKREIRNAEELLDKFNRGETSNGVATPLGLQQTIKELRQRLTDLKRGNF